MHILRQEMIFARIALICSGVEMVIAKGIQAPITCVQGMVERQEVPRGVDNEAVRNDLTMYITDVTISLSPYPVLLQ